MRTNVIPFVVTTIIAWLALGFAFYLQPNGVELAVLAGLAGLSLAAIVWTVLRFTRPQWLLGLAVYGLWISAFYARFPWGILVAALSIAVGYYMAVLFVRDELAGTNIDASEAVLRAILQRSRSLQQVKAPDSGLVAKLAEQPGPRSVKVPVDTAVIFAQNNRQPRIEGPGLYTTAPAEVAQTVLSLNAQRRTLTYGGVLIRDGVTVTVQATAFVGLAVRPEVASGAAKLTPAECESIQRARRLPPEWDADLRNNLERSVRLTIGEYDLEAVLAAENSQPICDTIMERANRELGSWGLALRSFTLTSIQPAPEVMAALQAEWLAARRADIDAVADDLDG